MSFQATTLKNDLTLADKLKALRQAHGLGVKEFSQELKIHVSDLRNLENGVYEKLPAAVYIKGFLKRYARFCQVSFTELYQQYDKERFVFEKLNKKSPDIVRTMGVLRSVKPFLTPRILIIILGGVLLAGLFGYFGYQVNFLLKSPVIVLESPSADIITWDKNLIIKGTASANGQLWLNNQPLKTDKDGHFESVLSLSQGLNSIKLVVENPFGKKTEMVRNIMFR